jgi:hypothetical protein
MFLPGDKVKYVGRRNELATKRGEVVCEIRNERNAVVVDFGDDAYICYAESLRKFTPTPVEEQEVEIVRKRKFELD